MGRRHLSGSWPGPGSLLPGALKVLVLLLLLRPAATRPPGMSLVDGSINFPIMRWMQNRTLFPETDLGRVRQQRADDSMRLPPNLMIYGRCLRTIIHQLCNKQFTTNFNHIPDGGCSVFDFCCRGDKCSLGALSEYCAQMNSAIVPPPALSLLNLPGSQPQQAVGHLAHTNNVNPMCSRMNHELIEREGSLCMARFLCMCGDCCQAQPKRCATNHRSHFAADTSIGALNPAGSFLSLLPVLELQPARREKVLNMLKIKALNTLHRPQFERIFSSNQAVPAQRLHTNYALRARRRRRCRHGSC